MTPFELPVLSETQIRDFLALLDREAAERGRRHGLPTPTDAPEAAWHALVQVPEGGIPALANVMLHKGATGTGGTAGYGDSPGSADCEVFELWETLPTGVVLQAGQVDGLGYTIKVYNAGSSLIPGNDAYGNMYVLAERDQFGTWWAGGSAGGGAGGCEPDVQALTDATPSFSGCTLTITGTKKQFNCDGTTTTLTSTSHNATLPTVSKTFLTDVTISGSCTGTAITISVTKTTDTVKVPSGC